MKKMFKAVILIEAEDEAEAEEILNKYDLEDLRDSFVIDEVE